MDDLSHPPSDDAPDTDHRLVAENHLRELATAELREVRAVLTTTGKDLESTRERCQALMAELDATRDELSEREVDLADTRSALQATKDGLTTALTDADRAARENALTFQALQNHVERLKAQIQSPWRLVAKWCLRRGPYASAFRIGRH